MRINEVSGAETESARLLALAQFLLSRAQDTDAKKTISIAAFLNLAKSMGISMTADQLRNLSQQPPLNGVIASIDGDDQTGTVIFKGSEVGPDQMTVDQAQQTVDSMAKRATSKRGL